MENLELDFENIDLDQLKDYLIEYERKITHNCFDHLKIVKKLKNNKNGSDSFIHFRQCQVCGCQKLAYLKASDAFKLNDFEEIEDFNYEAEDLYCKNSLIYNKLNQELHSRTDSEDEKLHSWILNHNITLEKEKQELLISNLIEYKNKTSSNFIHIINKFLQKEYPIKEEEKAISNLFNQANYSHKEEILKKWFEKTFSKFFEFMPNHWGVCDFENSKVEIDYIIRLSDNLKSHILQHIPSFQDIGYFGVEVKYFDISGNSHKLPEAFAQCIDYSFSKFHIDNKEIRLPCIILLSNLSFDKEYQRYEENHDIHFRTSTFIHAQKNLARKFNIGEFKFETQFDSIKLKSWSISLLDQNYIRYSTNGTETKYTQNKNFSLQRKVGNRS